MPKMNYSENIKNNYPIGSRVTEAAYKVIVSSVYAIQG